MKRTSWKKFRKTGEEQAIVPPVPAGTIVAFAGPANKIPGGWLSLVGGPYVASEYETLASLIGVEVVSGVQYLSLPRAPGTVTSTTQLTGEILKNRAILGTNSSTTPGTYGGQATATPLTAEQTGLRSHTDHSVGASHNHSLPGVTEHRHGVNRASIQIQYVADADGGDPVNMPAVISGNPSFTSGTSTYGLSLDSATTNATLDTYTSPAVSGHENRQPSLEMHYIIKT